MSVFLLGLNIRNIQQACPVLYGTVLCMLRLALYVIPCLLILSVIRFRTKIPSFVFRKILHTLAFVSSAVMIIRSGSCLCAVLAFLAVSVILYPFLSAVESRPWYARLFVEKKPGELKKSLCLFFVVIAAVTTAAWGLFGAKHLAVAAILMWGPGDAAAALVGIPFGKHRISWPAADSSKSWEGTLAMFAASFVCGFLVLRFYGSLGTLKSLICALVSSLAGAFVELVSKGGNDTFTVPPAILASLLILTSVF